MSMICFDLLIKHLVVSIDLILFMFLNFVVLLFSFLFKKSKAKRISQNRKNDIAKWLLYRGGIFRILYDCKSSNP